MADVLGIEQSGGVVASIEAEIEKASPSRRKRIWDAITLAALGSIPWVGAVMAASAAFKAGEDTDRADDLRTQWLQEHEHRLLDLRSTLEGMFMRFEGLGQEIEERIGSEQYLAIIRKAFRGWDQADTAQKRELIVKLMTHAAGARVCSDDILRLFLNWIEQYHESHFAVIREIYKNPGPTRYDIWIALYGETIPRDDSAEADMYKMLIRDLSLGGVIRQPRESDMDGRFRKKTTPSRRFPKITTLESPFEDTKQYVLTELGSQFVHYTMTELVTRIGNDAASNPIS